MKAWAEDTLPTLKEHLEGATDLNAKVDQVAEAKDAKKSDDSAMRDDNAVAVADKENTDGAPATRPLGWADHVFARRPELRPLMHTVAARSKPKPGEQGLSLRVRRGSTPLITVIGPPLRNPRSPTEVLPRASGASFYIGMSP